MIQVMCGTMHLTPQISDRFSPRPDPMSATFDRDVTLGQWMTPAWAAEDIVQHHFADLTSNDRVIEPSCGIGRFLAALPAHVPTVGVEIDPALAQMARRNTGREVLVGDFRTVDLPFKPTVMLGNPPFQLSVVEGFLDRAYDLLPTDGRVGFILPCYMLQTAGTVVRLNRKWGMQQEMIPRNLFPGLSKPLCFAMLTRGAGKGMVGFRLYHEAEAISRLATRYREILENGESSVWYAVTLAALEKLGGEARVADILGEVAGHQPTGNPHWAAKVRQTLQRRMVSTSRGVWKLPEALAA